MYNHYYWYAIALDPPESKEFHDTARTLDLITSPAEREVIVNKIISSPQSSLNYKRKIVFRIPMVRSSRGWGCKNFEGEDLIEYIENLFLSHSHFLTYDDLLALAKNPAFASSCGGPFDVIDFIFRRSSVVTKEEISLRNVLINNMVEENTMNENIAETIIKLNYKRNRYVDSPIIEWARKKHNLENLPDTWVRKFLNTQ